MTNSSEDLLQAINAIESVKNYLKSK